MADNGFDWVARDAKDHGIERDLAPSRLYDKWDWSHEQPGADGDENDKHRSPGHARRPATRPASGAKHG